MKVRRLVVGLLALLAVGSAWSDPRLTLVRNFDGTVAYVDETGKVVMSTKYPMGFEFSEGLARVKPTHQDTVFIDPTGATVIAPLSLAHAGDYRTDKSISRATYYDVVGDFKDGLARVRYLVFSRDKENTYLNQQPNYGYIDKTGKLQIDASAYSAAEDFSGGFARVKRMGGWGYIDTKGDLVASGPFEEAEDFSEGLAKVKYPDGKRYGYVDTSGASVLRPDFEMATNFHDGVALVYNVDASFLGYIDRTGRQLDSWKDVLKRLLGTKYKLNNSAFFLKMFESYHGIRSYVLLVDGGPKSSGQTVLFLERDAKVFAEFAGEKYGPDMTGNLYRFGFYRTDLGFWVNRASDWYLVGFDGVEARAGSVGPIFDENAAGPGVLKSSYDKYATGIVIGAGSVGIHYVSNVTSSDFSTGLARVWSPSGRVSFIDSGFHVVYTE